MRYSLENPSAYVDSNLVGFVNMLELCRHRGVQHLVYASSSSVYGDSATPPFSEDQRVDQPRSLYAATKAANELMGYTYAQLYGLRATGLRFFTVYGPWGRPDMAPLIFSRAVLAGRPIEVFNHGRMQRDFTFVDDIVAGVLGALDTPSGEPVPHRVFNLGNHTPVEPGILHRRDRPGRRAPGREGLPANAAGRHDPHHGRYAARARRLRLRAGHPGRARPAAGGGLVPQLFRRARLGRACAAAQRRSGQTIAHRREVAPAATGVSAGRRAGALSFPCPTCTILARITTSCLLRVSGYLTR